MGPFSLTLALVFVFLAFCFYGGGAVEWFVESPYCHPLLKRVLFMFLVAAWVRGAAVVVARLM